MTFDRSASRWAHCKQACSYPAGALASAKFNVAKHLTSIADRRERLRDAFADIQLALSHEKEDSSGLYAVRASINRKLGHVFDAASDLERSLAIHRQNGMQDSALGSTFSELGFAYLYSLRLRKGLKLCEEGVTTLRAARSSPPDLARALRKLAVAYAMNGRLRKSRNALEESQILAAKSNVHDQRR